MCGYEHLDMDLNVAKIKWQPLLSPMIVMLGGFVLLYALNPRLLNC